MNTMATTYQSEYGKLHSVFIKKATDAFVSNDHIEKYWQQLNYLGKPSMEKANDEYAVFENILEQSGSLIYHLPSDSNVNMDSIYCRDAAIATDGGMIICSMGKVARSNEPGAERKAFELNNIPVLGTISAPGTIEGGDVAWLDEKTLAVGHTYRTNEEGIRQLKSFVEPLGVEVIVVPLPHYKGPSDVFHLMSILSPVDKDLAVVYSPLMPIVFREYLLNKGYQLVEVPDNEFDSMGCNVLALGPRVCLMVKGNPVTRKRMEDAGCKVIEYEGEEISVKGGGGPTCLTRPLQRYK